MSTLSILCGIGYLVAVDLILKATNADLTAPVLAVIFVGAMALGWHCAACDRAEGRN